MYPRLPIILCFMFEILEILYCVHTNEYSLGLKILAVSFALLTLYLIYLNWLFDYITSLYNYMIVNVAVCVTLGLYTIINCIDCVKGG